MGLLYPCLVETDLWFFLNFGEVLALNEGTGLALIESTGDSLDSSFLDCLGFHDHYGFFVSSRFLLGMDEFVAHSASLNGYLMAGLNGFGYDSWLGCAALGRL